MTRHKIKIITFHHKATPIMAKDEERKHVDDFHGTAQCEKVPHALGATGHLHDKDDDGPYSVDGCLYCGRCHRFLRVDR